MPQKVNIVVNKHTPFVTGVFKDLGNVVALDTKEIKKDAVKDADILIVRSETRVDAGLIEGSRVKFVGTVTIGTDHVDKEYLLEKGITFVSAPGSNANSVGEYIAAALLELAHDKGFLLQDKTIGIVGVGNVGSNVRHKAEALGMKVLLNDPPLERKGSAYPLKHLEDLMDADIISIHVPLTRVGPDATYHFFNEERVRKMKHGAILINTSRGAAVETEAVKRSLQDGHLSAAVLDVWEKEPDLNTSLLELVSLGTPHIAGYSLDGKFNALKMNYEAACRFLSKPCNSKIDSVIPPTEISEISIDPNSGSKNEIFRQTIKQCYDIKMDDQLLRRIMSVPEKERGAYFSSLRANYRIRREFINTALVIPEKFNDQSIAVKDVARDLKALGFKIKKIERDNG